MERIRLLLVGDHTLGRESLSQVLAAEPDFEIVGQCGTSADALELLTRASVDVVLIDLELETGQGNHFISSARRAGYAGKSLVVTVQADALESLQAFRRGVSGIFLKQNAPAALAKAIRLVSSGELWIEQSVIQLMTEEVHRQERGFGKVLTEREQRVLQGIVDGLTNKDIGARLSVSEGAVKATLQRMFRKTQVRTRSQLIRVALESKVHASRSEPRP